MNDRPSGLTNLSLKSANPRMMSGTMAHGTRSKEKKDIMTTKLEVNKDNDEGSRPKKAALSSFSTLAKTSGKSSLMTHDLTAKSSLLTSKSPLQSSLLKSSVPRGTGGTMTSSLLTSHSGSKQNSLLKPKSSAESTLLKGSSMQSSLLKSGGCMQSSFLKGSMESSVLKTGSSMQSSLLSSSTLKTSLSGMKPSSLCTSAKSTSLLGSYSSATKNFSLTTSSALGTSSLQGKAGSPMLSLGSASANLTSMSLNTTSHMMGKGVTHAGSKVGNRKRPHKAHNERVLPSDMDLPEYDFQDEWDGAEDKVPLRSDFLPPEEDKELLQLSTPVHDIHSIKRGLINAVSGSLIRAPDFKEANDPFRLELIAVAERVSFYDAEFILKVALYTRNELNIRTTANFLLAFASNNRACRPYLRKYYGTAIRLPSDWIDVAEQYQAFYDPGINFGSLPAALRRVMVAKFPAFDKYQLGKYNKESSSKKAKKKAKKAKAGEERAAKRGEDGSRGRGRGRGGRGRGRGGNDGSRGRGRGRGGRGGYGARPGRDSDSGSSSSDDSDGSEDEAKEVDRQLSAMTDGETEEELAKKSFTLKQLIRKLHVTEPVEHVMCLIGKKYPATSEDFYQSRLPGTFEEERAGKRMKLPTPETWETQVSMKGNKAKTWEDLIDHKKLPFMAMLRNLRNMVKAGISNKHHTWVIKKLTDEGAVINSRQFPFRFFSAYEVLEQLERDYEKNQQDIISAAEAGSAPTPGRGRGRGRGARGGRGGRGGRGRGRGGGVKLGADGLPEEVPYDAALLKRYRTALDKAVKIATVYNVKPIRGKTLIFVNLGTNMDKPCSSARGLGAPRTVKDVGVLLGLMCKYSCEDSLYVGYGSNTHIEIELEKGTILHNMERVLTNPEVNAGREDRGARFPDHYLYSLLLNQSQQVDNVIILSDGMNLSSDEGQCVTRFLDLYRRIVNPNLLFVSVDLSGARAGMDKTIEPGHENDIYIAGYSDQILRFIAERGDDGQLLHVDKIDEAYDLKALPPGLLQNMQRDQAVVGQKRAGGDTLERPLKLTCPVPRWKTVRVFISSTFRDMHGERDLLTRYVFPEIRARAAKHFLKVHEVDLRWGITEEDTKSESTLQLCLRQVLKCNMFIGLLGERYGWVPEEHQIPEEAEFDWVRNYPRGRSVTELEMYGAALCRPSESRGRAFFYLRDSGFESDVPKMCRKDFFAENEEKKKRMADLKSKIRTSGLEVYDEYPCMWGGVADGKPMVGGLESLGQRVLNNLWTALEDKYIQKNPMMDELAHTRSLHEAYMASFLDTFAGRKPLQKIVLNSMKDMRDGGLLVLAGKPGSGKSAFTASVIDLYKKVEPTCNTVIHFMGAAPGSTNIVATLHRLVSELCNQFSLGHVTSEDYKNLVPQLADVLKESGEACGGGTLLLCIDGVEMLEDTHGARAMDWLPGVMPKNVLMLLSMRMDSDCYKNIKRRMDVREVVIGPLQILDKSEVARNMLAVHNKSLNEAAFGNQMKLLVNKREASNPLYLSLVCSELALFGVFEQLSARLKTLSQTVPQVLQEVLERLEQDHGEALVSLALSLLLCSPGGIIQEHLQLLLSYAQLVHKATGGFKMADVLNLELKPQEMLPSAVFLALVTGLRTLLRPNPDSDSAVLALSHREIETAIRLRYFKAGLVNREVQMNEMLAGFYTLQADPNKDQSWKGTSAKALAALPRHLARAGLYKELSEVLCDLCFIYAKCEQGLAVQLMEDFQGFGLEGKGANKAREEFLKSERVQAYSTFVCAQIHILMKHPGLLWQQAINEPEDSCPCIDARAVLQENIRDEEVTLMEWINKPRDVSPCVYTISNMAEPVTTVAVSPDSRYLATGSKDCIVRIYDLSTGHQLKEFTGHADGITCVCFVGDSRLCSASADNTLSLWNISDGHRISVLKKHSRQVQSCTADSKGKVIVSAGWDSTLRVWNGGTGKFQYDLYRDRAPYNCAAWHPEDSLLVTGSWDAAIRIFDVYNKLRKAVLRGHLTSVRAVAYSACGRHICSASLDGEVKVWWAATGTQVGGLSGHAAPISSLTFTPTGDEVITVSDDHTIKVWSGHMGQLVRTLDQSEDNEQSKMADEESNAVESLSISRDGTQIALGYHDGHLRIYDVVSGLPDLVKQVHKHAITAIRYCRDSKALVTGAADGSAKLWNKDRSLRAVLTAHNKGVLSAACGDQWLVTTSHDCMAALYKLGPLRGGNKFSPNKMCSAHTAPVTGCDLNMDETALVTVSRDTEMMFWDLTQNCAQPTRVIHACHLDWVTCCAWSDTGDFVVTGSTDFSLKVWDVTSYTEKFKLEGHQSAVNSVAYSNGCVVSCSSDGLMKVWSHKGVEITTLTGHNLTAHACDILVKMADTTEKEIDMEAEPIEDWATQAEMEDWQTQGQAKFAPREKVKVVLDVLVASGSEDGTAKIWRPLQGNQVATLNGHNDRVTSVAATRDAMLATGALDRSLKLWRYKVTETADIEDQGHSAEVSALASLNENNLFTIVVTGSRDGSIKVWKHEVYQVPLCTATIQDEDVSAVSGVTFVPAGRDNLPRFATCTESGTVSVWAIYPKKNYAFRRLRKFTEKTHHKVHPFTSIQCLSSTLLATTNWRGEIQLWDWNTSHGAPRNVFKLHTHWVMSSNLSKDYLHTGGADETVQSHNLFEIFKGGIGSTIQRIRHAGQSHLAPNKQKAVWITALAQDGDQVVVGDVFGRLGRYKAGTASTATPPMKQIHTAAITAIVPEAEVLFTASRDGSVKVWDKQLTQVGQFFAASPVTQMKLMRKTDGNIQLACGHQLGTVSFLRWNPSF